MGEGGLKLGQTGEAKWQAGSAPVAVIMIALNEAHNMEAVLQNLKGWAQEVFLVDSYSADDTVEIALRHGVHVVQRQFRGFGDQWNFALSNLPITAPWTMKLDPDERLTASLKENISTRIKRGDTTGISFERRLWFMGRPLPVMQEIVRIWRTGSCRFTDVSVNEHPLVEGNVTKVKGYLDHHDSPNLHRWIEKQNMYTTAEAVGRYNKSGFAANPNFFGQPLERRMWIKKHFMQFPFRYQLLFLVNLCRAKPWFSGYAGLAWARLRVWVTRTTEDKLKEMRFNGKAIEMPAPDLGAPHPFAEQAEQ